MDIVIHCSGLPISGEDPVALSLGGAESAVVWMARALARLGHDVAVYCNTPGAVAGLVLALSEPVSARRLRALVPRSRPLCRSHLQRRRLRGVSRGGALDHDWLLWLDADEVLSGGARLRQWIDSNVYADAFAVEERESGSPDDGATAVRCFRPVAPEGRLRWFGCAHETVGLALDTPPVRLLTVPGVRVERPPRTAAAGVAPVVKDREEHPERRRGYLMGMREYLRQARCELARAHGMTRESYRCLNLGFEIWTAHVRRFPAGERDEGFRLSRQILAVLARCDLPLRATGLVPLEVTLDLAARPAPLPEPAQTLHFADAAELREHLDRRLAELTEHLDDAPRRAPWVSAGEALSEAGPIGLPAALFGLEEPLP